ncbi:hypothetical protein [Polyangium sp. 6x1]|nr:hypothetical protein [Polyangium sp. 6x1]MDI1451084.1 hypothetical protein [Polyangium sp. 6x1]
MNDDKKPDDVEVELESLNMQDLAVEALEQRVEMATLAQTTEAWGCIINW